MRGRLARSACFAAREFHEAERARREQRDVAALTAVMGRVRRATAPLVQRVGDSHAAPQRRATVA